MAWNSAGVKALVAAVAAVLWIIGIIGQVRSGIAFGYGSNATRADQPYSYWIILGTQFLFVIFLCGVAIHEISN